MPDDGEDTQQNEWQKHYCKVDRHSYNKKSPPEDPDKHKREIEPWLTALFQTEHLNLLLGSGFSIAACSESDVDEVDMSSGDLDVDFNDRLQMKAEESAERIGRGSANIEDRIRTATQLLRGLEVWNAGEAPDEQGESNEVAREDSESEDAGSARTEKIDAHAAESTREDAQEDANGESQRERLNKKQEELKTALNSLFEEFLNRIVQLESELVNEWEKNNDVGAEVRSLLVSFLLSFATRSPSKERLHLFTTNYDRLIERMCDVAGLRVLDRFVGALTPEFRTTRVDVDMHYNPPGIRGEPRYLEGVVRLTKLHGSIDWRMQGDKIQQERSAFGSEHAKNSIPEDPLDSVIVFPNAVKDIETSAYPYAQLFRDFSAALCRPNAVLVTYGYGFGDSHINNVIEEMLQIPSTHLVIISFDHADGRIRKFFDEVARPQQISVLLGKHFAHIRNLCNQYLPTPNIDRVSFKRNELLKRRNEGQVLNTQKSSDEDGDGDSSAATDG